VKIKEIIIDYFMSTTLFEMAHERQLVIDRVRSKARPIIDHLVYLHFYPDSDYADHWIKELNAFVDEFDDLYLKPGGRKKLTGNRYYQILFREPLEGDIKQLRKFITRALKKEGQPTVTVSDTQLLEWLEKILHKLSYDVANDVFDDIKNYLK